MSGSGIDALDRVVRDLPGAVHVIAHDGMTASFEVTPEEISVSEVIAKISGQVPIADIAVREPKMEEVIREIYEARKVTR